ncbi:MAG: starch-binding protein [Ruminococcus sp.]|nr:starch-binding protein [Ruminococcus sp.]
MRMLFKKLTAIFLAVLMIMSVMSVVSVSASQKDDKGQYMIKFTNTKGWADIYVHAWNNDNPYLCGDWPGWKMENTFIGYDSWGNSIIWLYIPGDATGFVVSNGQGDQTNDITDFSPEGYWVDDNGQAQPWGGTDDESSSGSTEYNGEVSGNLKFIDTYRWGNIHCYAWNDDGDENAPWPGVKMDGPGDDGYGNPQYGTDLSDEFTHVIFNDGVGTDGGGNQTEDLDWNSGIAGFYFDESGSIATWNNGGWSGSGGYSGGGEECSSIAEESSSSGEEVSDSLKFKDYQGWGNIHCYAWNDYGVENAPWPGVKMDGPGDDGFGNPQYSTNLSDVYTHIIFNDGRGTDGGGYQTPDLYYDSGVIGVYFDCDKWYYIRHNPSVGIDDIEYDESVYDGDYLIFDFSNYNTDLATKWYCWTWKDGESGRWADIRVLSSSRIRFENIESNIKLIQMPADSSPDLDGIIYCRTENLNIESDTLVLLGKYPWGELSYKWAGKRLGESEPEEITEVEETSTYTEPDTTEPDTETTEAPEKTSEPEETTEEPEERTTIPEETDDPSIPLTAQVRLNGAVVKSQQIYGDTLRVTYMLTSPDPVVDAQATLTYDNKKLRFKSWEFPLVDAAVIDNTNVSENKAAFNFTSPKKPYNFSFGEILVSVEFSVISGSTGYANVDLRMVELDTDKSLVTNGVVEAVDQSVFDSLKDVDVFAGYPPSETETETETESRTEAETVTESGTEAETATESGTEIETATESGTEAETATESRTEAETATESGTEAETATEAEETTEYIADREFNFLPDKQDYLNGCDVKFIIRDSYGSYHTYQMTKTPLVYNGVPVFSATVPGSIVPKLVQFQVYYGEVWRGQLTLTDDLLSNTDGKIITGDGSILGENEPTTTATAPATQPYFGVRGDVDGNESFDVRDATAIKQFVAELIELSPQQQLIANVNNDDVVDVRDATALQQILAELRDFDYYD